MSMKNPMLPLAALCLTATVTVATAQAWPTKEPIKVIVPFTAGSATDIIARVVFNQVRSKSARRLWSRTAVAAALRLARPGRPCRSRRLHAAGELDVACGGRVGLRAFELQRRRRSHRLTALARSPLSPPRQPNTSPWPISWLMAAPIPARSITARTVSAPPGSCSWSISAVPRRSL